MHGNMKGIKQYVVLSYNRTFQERKQQILERTKEKAKKNSICKHTGISSCIEHTGMDFYTLLRLVYYKYISDMGQHLGQTYRAVSFFGGRDFTGSRSTFDLGSPGFGNSVCNLYHGACIPPEKGQRIYRFYKGIL